MAVKKVKVAKYTAVFEPAEEGGYVVTVPVLPGCVTQGDTFEEAVYMIKDAIEGYLAVMEDVGEEIPEDDNEPIVTRVEVKYSSASA